jgi:hypothetical protein
MISYIVRYTGYAVRSGFPTLIAIDHDDYYASRVGATQDGIQFFVTTSFIPALGDETGREFLAVFLFDPTASLARLELTISALAPP